jgi:hypothetical protein
MRKEDCVDMLQRIPLETHPQINFILRNGCILSVDTIVRYEATYIIFRGREGGSTDENRAFFVPYEEICHLKIERAVRIGELKKMYGEAGYVDAEDRLSVAAEAEAEAAKTAAAAEAEAAAQVATQVVATDPGSIAKQNLLKRIRMARANVAGTATGKLGSSDK